MTTYSPADCYDYCTTIKSPIYGFRDKSVVLFPDFECTVSISTELSEDGFDLSARCTDVLVDGESLINGDEFAKRVRLLIMAEVDAALSARTGIWDDVIEREGLSLTDYSGNPDAHWERV